MTKKICDKCGEIITGVNFGRSYTRYEDERFSVLVKAGLTREPHLKDVDICQKCLIEMIEKTMKE